MRHVFFPLILLMLFNPAIGKPRHLPARSFSEIQGKIHPSRFLHKPAIRVTSARVLYADYELIQRDFEITRFMSPARIEEWLLDSAARISGDQISVGEKRGVNTSIHHDPKDLHPALRPPNYGRGMVLEVEGGIIDAKGAGGLAPAISQSSHRTGLLETAEAIREFAYSKLVKRALEHSGSEFGVIDSYAVIDFGFQVRSTVDGTFQPAGLLLRQAHFRDASRSEQLDAVHARKIELALRDYGITTAYKKIHSTEIPGLLFDVLNVQGSGEGLFLFDFGGYRIRDRFQNQAVLLSDVLGKRILPVLSETDVKHAQPSDEFKSLVSAWGGEGSSEKIWVKSKEIAEQFKLLGDSEKTRLEIKALLAPTSAIPAEPKKGRGKCMESLKHP